MRRLSRYVAVEADIRPTLLGVVTLMFLLLFFLLSTSSGQKLATLDLSLRSPEDLAPLPHSGLLKRLVVTMQGHTIEVLAEVQSTDIAAAATSVERRVTTIPAQDGRVDVRQLQETVLVYHRLDPSQQEAELSPDDRVPVADLLLVMDTLRGPAAAPYFPKVALTGVGG